MGEFNPNQGDFIASEKFPEIFVSTFEADNASDTVVVYLPGHDVHVGAGQKRPRPEDNQDKLVVETMLKQGLGVITGSTPLDVNDTEQTKTFFELITSAVEDQRKQGKNIVFAGHSFGGMYLEYAIQNGFLIPEEDDMILSLSSPRSAKDLVGLSKLALTPAGRLAISAMQTGFNLKEKASGKPITYNARAHRNRLKFMATHEAEVQSSVRFHHHDDVYVLPPANYTTYEEAGVPASYSENEGSMHNYVPFMDLLIKKAGEIIADRKLGS